MATKDGSVAPKERVNIVYRPATGDVQEDVELPLKLMVIGDFIGRTDDRSLEDRDPINIDKNNFNDVMASQNISLDLQVMNKISNETNDPDNKLSVKLKFSGIRDFEPDSIVKQIPELGKILELREALKALKSPLSNVPDFRKKVQEMVSNDEARKKLFAELGLDKDDKK